MTAMTAMTAMTPISRISGATLCLYHGSPYVFTTFKHSEAGIHFGTYDQAVHAATIHLGRMPLDAFEALVPVNGWRGRIYQCRVSLGRTKRIKDPRTPEDWTREIKRAITEGYTSIVYLNEFEGFAKEDSYCVFTPDCATILHVER